MNKYLIEETIQRAIKHNDKIHYFFYSGGKWREDYLYDWDTEKLNKLPFSNKFGYKVRVAKNFDEVL